MYVQKYAPRHKKTERLHVRICPKLKQNFEEKVEVLNQYLVEEDQQDMSAWVNFFIEHFVAFLDEFGANAAKEGILEDWQDFAKSLSYEQMVLFYLDNYSISVRQAVDQKMKLELPGNQGGVRKIKKFMELLQKMKWEKKK